MALADQASSAQDVAALGLIASAGVAAGGLVYGSSIDLIKGAGLAAGTLTATTSYFKPGEASTALLAAAGQLICLTKVADLQLVGEIEATPILRNAIQTIRLNLRRSLAHTLPDYSQLVQALQTAATPRGARLVQEDESLTQFRAAIAACIATQ